MTDSKTERSFRDVSAASFILIISVANMVLYHAPLYRFAMDNLSLPGLPAILTFATLLVVLFLVTVLLLSIVGILVTPLLKPLCMLLALCNGIAMYFMLTYNVIFDKDMMGNVFNTRVEESAQFLHPKLFLYVVGFGIVPAWLISRLRIKSVKRVWIAVQAVIVLLVSLTFIYLNSPTWLWFDKHAKRLGGAILPWSYLHNTVRAFSYKNRNNKVLTMLPPGSLKDDEKMLVVLVIGETARSNNFSLYGYERETNPQLGQLDISVLEDARACSTYTTASIHCMLSHTGKTSGSFETLPGYLQRHGVEVIWRSNNWGEPQISVDLFENAGQLNKKCSGEHCELDDVLLVELDETVRSASSNKVFVVLHVKGSHGPSYYSMYPEKFEVFTPVCKSVELVKCSEQSLINAYDNTILYTDDFLNRSIDILRAFDDRPVAFMYVSDHGESLGEFGLYLHGTPYTIAPDVQKDIPFLVWMSEEFKTVTSLESSDLTLTSEKHAHEQVFHSVLGAFGMQSEVYKPELDLFTNKK